MAESSAEIGAASGPGQALRIRPGWALASIFLLIMSVPLAFLQAPFPRPEQPFGERSVLAMFRYPLEVNAMARMPSGPTWMRALTVTADQLGGGFRWHDSDHRGWRQELGRAEQRHKR